MCSGFDFRQIKPDQSLEFYSWFLAKAKSEYRMLSYELDFVNQNLNCIHEFTTSIAAATTVFDGMAKAAQSLGLVMQWCYATPSAALQSLNYPSMTNMRASFDYVSNTSLTMLFPSSLFRLLRQKCSNVLAHFSRLAVPLSVLWRVLGYWYFEPSSMGIGYSTQHRYVLDE